MLSGRKRWFFLDPFKYHQDLQWARGEKFRPDNPLLNMWTDWVYLDPDHVDLIVQHRLREMDYYELIQEPGDCIVLPYAILHQVQKLDDALQVAASWMFVPETIYEEQVCAEAPLEEDLPLGAMDVLYMYNGTGLIPQGYMDPLQMVGKVEHRMMKKKERYLTLATFTEVVTEGEAILKTIEGREDKIRSIFDTLTSKAKEPKRGLTRRELTAVPLRLWAKPAAEGDYEGPLQSDIGEEYVACDDAEMAKMSEFVRARLATHRSADPDPKEAQNFTQPKNTRIWKKRGLRSEL
uniref:JmjC domain-containing protein n=1 Tax=Noctiluca scintillans TaxID=2966 RepID=A0A7S1AAX2_NOCSC